MFPFIHGGIRETACTAVCPDRSLSLKQLSLIYCFYLGFTGLLGRPNKQNYANLPLFFSKKQSIAMTQKATFSLVCLLVFYGLL